MADAAGASAAAVAASLAPVLATYSGSVASVLQGQAALEAQLRGVLAELAGAQGGGDAAGASARMGEYAGRLEALRRRLEGVGGVMARVQGRLERLQQTVTQVELREREAQRSAAAASKAAALEAAGQQEQQQQQ
jgi:CII-binding regulator of phage lambda lysogenization HflD